MNRLNSSILINSRLIFTLFLIAAFSSSPFLQSQDADAQRKSHRQKTKKIDIKAGKKKKQEMVQKLSQIKGSMNEVKSEIKETKIQENVMLESMETVQARMDQTKFKLNEVSAKIETLDGLHEKALIRQEKTQARLNGRKALLGTRLKDNYQRNQETYIQTLFDSKSLHQMLSRSYYIRLIVNSDAKLIQAINEDVRQIKEVRRILEKQESEQRTLEAELELQKTEFASDLSKKRIILNGIQASRIQAESELDDLASEASTMSERIRALSDMLRRQQEAARRASIQKPVRTRRGSHADITIPLPTTWHGAFSRPCDGPVTSGFGVRFHPILHRTRMHTGVDFGAGYGASIRSAAGGVVIMSGYSRGYGNCIIVDHGGGVTTLYGHCSARLVHEGQTVLQGEVIGRVGATGMATGPHLHFEVRHNGSPVAPL